MNRERFFLSTIADVCEDETSFAIRYEPRTADLAAQCGFGLELAEYCLSDNMDDDSAVRAHFERNVRRAKRRVMHAPFNELLPHAIDKKVARVAEERLSRAWEICQKAGCEKMVVHVNHINVLYFPTWTASRQIEFWKRFLAAHAGDTVICLENVMEEDPGVILDIIEGVDDERLRMCLDVGHANLTGLPVMEWLRTCAKHISHFHLHNNNGPAKGCAGAGDTHKALGDGTIPMRELLLEADRLVPKATFTVETNSLRPSVDWLSDQGFLS